MQAPSEIRKQRFNVAERSFGEQLAELTAVWSASTFQQHFGFEPSAKFSFQAVLGRDVEVVSRKLARAQVDCVAFSGGHDPSENYLKTNLDNSVANTKKKWASYKTILDRYQSGLAEVELHKMARRLAFYLFEVECCFRYAELLGSLHGTAPNYVLAGPGNDAKVAVHSQTDVQQSGHQYRAASRQSVVAAARRPPAPATGKSSWFSGAFKRR